MAVSAGQAQEGGGISWQESRASRDADGHAKVVMVLKEGGASEADVKARDFAAFHLNALKLHAGLYHGSQEWTVIVSGFSTAAERS